MAKRAGQSRKKTTGKGTTKLSIPRGGIPGLMDDMRQLGHPGPVRIRSTSRFLPPPTPVPESAAPASAAHRQATTSRDVVTEPPAAALAGLSHAEPVAGRLVPRPAGAHLILDDTYNANPASMIAGLRVLAACPGRKLAILGPMGELGPALVEGHRAVGAEARRLGLPLLIVAGRGGLAGAEVHLAAGYGSEAVVVADRPAAIAAAQTRLAVGSTTVLVKASRSQALEAVVSGLGAAPAPGGAHP